MKHGIRWSPLLCPVKRELEVELLWQLRQKVPVGMYEVSPVLVRLEFQRVFGPLSRKLAVEPCGPLGSAVLLDSWQSEQVMRLVRLQGEMMFDVAPRLLAAEARTG